MTTLQNLSPLLSLHEALASALRVDLPAITPTATNWTAESVLHKELTLAEQGKTRQPNAAQVRSDPCRPRVEDVEVQLFLQTWGSTALGYGEKGSASTTSAYTVIVSTCAEACIYFGEGVLAYQLKYAAMTLAHFELWREDLGRCTLACRAKAPERYGAQLPLTTSV